MKKIKTIIFNIEVRRLDARLQRELRVRDELVRRHGMGAT